VCVSSFVLYFRAVLLTPRVLPDVVTVTAAEERDPSLNVSEHVPVSNPGVIVNATDAPEEAGVACVGEICATNALVAGDWPLGLAVHVMLGVKAPAKFVSETEMVCGAGVAVTSNETVVSDVTGGTAGELKSAKVA
jgi:hypothetical protein